MTFHGKRLRMLIGSLILSGMPMVATALENIQTINTDELARLAAQGVTVIDVRRSDEWQSTGVVPGSRLITAYEANGMLDPAFVAAVNAAAPKDRPVVLICRSGNRSHKAAELMTHELGYTQVYDVAGGMLAWQGEGRPTTPCPHC